MESQPTAASDPVTDAFGLLDHRYRRYVVETLERHDCELTLADLADEVARREHDRPVSEIDSETVSELYLALYHTHVPKLAEGDAVRYDQESDTVEPRERVETLAQVLDAVR
ncbi:DUF7344 domain-containing protein [Halosimplex marinum]|uniref:DUF7344 domain-containing protein n=1 Tax=Halosimplex marinum TaxID=3396620 RepID=UPI003F56163A